MGRVGYVSNLCVTHLIKLPDYATDVKIIKTKHPPNISFKNIVKIRKIRRWDLKPCYIVVNHGYWTFCLYSFS